MQIPSVNPRTKFPPVKLGTVDYDLQDGYRESFLDLFRAKPGRIRNREQLLEYFAQFFGLQVFEDKTPGQDVWVYKFAVTDIKNEIGATDFGSSEIGTIVSLFLFFLHQPSISVTLEGQLIDARTGKVIAGYRLTEEFKASRSLFTRRVKSLPMIEVAAIKLLMLLKDDAQKKLSGAT
ncbi:MAG: hypothetical protein AAGA50_22570 [Pseudomonadota bacterium]